MADPRKTGISSITGKMVFIRHANDTDRVIIEEYLKKSTSEVNLENAEVVVAAENDRIIGFGILKKENGAGCVSLFEDSRRRGIGSTIVNHLVEFSSVSRVYASRYASYFATSNAAWLKKIRAGRMRNAARCRMPLMERLPAAAASGL
jgi:citrate lyase synthetase